MTAWHVSSDLLARYATEPEVVDDTSASSLELHLLRCAQCRATLSAASDPKELALAWDAVAERVDLPRPTPVERLLRLLGFSEAFSRPVAATRTLQLSWIVAMVAVVVSSVLLAMRVDDPRPFLIIAPTVPVLAVVLAFAPGSDPAGEAGSATPMSAVGLVAHRAIAVLTVSFVILAIGSLALPDLHLADAAWILPALGLSVGTLALATWTRVEVAASVLGSAWLTGLLVAAAYERPPISAAHLLPFAAWGQIACGALAVGGALVLVARRESFAVIGRVP
jgi:hypothetical protein